MKLLTLEFSPPSCYLLLGPNTVLSTLISDTR